MLVNKELGRGSGSNNALPLWVKDIIHAEVVQNTPHGQSIRMTRHNFQQNEFLCFEDNTQMLRLLLRLRDSGEFEMVGFAMDKPTLNHPARPPWTLSKAWHRVYDQPALEALEVIKTAFVEFFTKHPSHYPLGDPAKIRVTDDLRAIKNNKMRKEHKPLFFCGRVKSGKELENEAFEIQVEGLRDGERETVTIVLEKGQYYGKRPAKDDWIITKQLYLLVVVSDRELLRYYTYVPYSVQ